MAEAVKKDVALRANEQAQAPVTMDEPMTLMQVIANAARDPNVDVEKMRALLQMRKELETDEAERQFNEAMAETQSELRPVAADASNPQTKSKYASYAALDAVIRPIYSRHGFAISYDEGDSPKPEHVRVLAHVMHRAGHTRTYHKDMPADGKGAKGGDVMTKTHAAGSAMRYGMRYLLTGIFNIATGKDDDGNAAGAGEAVTQEQADRLIAIADEVGADKRKFCEFMSRHCGIDIDSFAAIPAKAYDMALRALQAKQQAGIKEPAA